MRKQSVILLGLVVGLTFLMAGPSGAVAVLPVDVSDTGQAVSRLDAMDSEERKAAVGRLGRYLIENDAGLDDLSSDTFKAVVVMCGIEPWSSDDTETDALLQDFAWRQMASRDPNGAVFRWLDCMAANRHGAYRETAVLPLYDLRQSLCTGIEIATDTDQYLDSIEEAIAEWNSATAAKLAGFASGGTPGKGSYFPLRNELRIALIKAARAVRLAGGGNWAAAQEEFSRAADGLEGFYQAETFRHTRNAWRFVDDLEFYVAFYRWLGGGSEPDYSRFLDWPPVLKNPKITTLISEEDRKVIEDEDPDYRDMIYLERLLPGASTKAGASDQSEECSGWRRRFYDIARLAATVQNCAASFEPGTAEGLSALDACILEYEADDWTLTILSFRNDAPELSKGEEKERARSFVEKATELVTRRGEDAGLADKLDASKFVFDEKESWTSIRLDQNFTTGQREALREIFSEVSNLEGRWNVVAPRFARPKLY